MHDDSALTLARIDRLITEWLRPARVRARHGLDVASWQAPGEPVPFADAVAQEFTPHAVGEPWGPAWSTVWFHLTGVVPTAWPEPGTRVEVDVDLGWDPRQPGFQAEGAAWSPQGVLVKGVSPRNSWVPIEQRPGGVVDLYVEAAANPDVPGGQWRRPTRLGDLATAGSEPRYRLEAVDVALVDVEVEELIADVAALRGLLDVLPAASSRRARILRALEDMCDAVDPDDVAGSAALARAALVDVLASAAEASAHVAHAVGHAHIDSAWLWPVRETVRKVGRTVGNVLALMDVDPDVTYAFSSAQQYAWLAERDPDLFARLTERVREGRIVPVGGMWVESDTNMVGGEAMVRQFLEGKAFFRESFGVEPTSVWLPDSFGYSGGLPQIARLAGCTDFLTQKLSWNDTNRIPHHTFWWEGIDGTRIFTHFPPVDTYNSDLGAADLDRAARQYAEKGRANRSLVPFGYGDGGGGPTREMVAQARRAADLEGSPRVLLSTPDEFFAAAREEYAHLAPTWAGELYLEYHRGTYTSQARTKQGNRRSEHLLREAELWTTTASVRAGVAYPLERLRALWRRTLLLQFHDILPGSSIAWVHREAEAAHAEIAAEATQIIDGALADLGVRAGLANASPFARHGVAPGAVGGVGGPGLEEVATASVRITPHEGGFVLSNEALLVVVDQRGLVVSAVVRTGDGSPGREVIAPGAAGNVLELARDIPNTWEAWDIDRHYRRNVTELVDVDLIKVTERDGVPTLHLVRRFSASTVEQWLTLAPGADPTLTTTTRVDWHERQKLLKLGFTLDVLTDQARSETQFGHITRPIHENTSWDQARFETVAHRWLHVGEVDFGVAFANDSSYGHDVTRVRSDGGDGPPATRVRVSLLRAPRFPDPEADQGAHTLRTSVTFGADVAAAVEHGYDLNLPLREVGSGRAEGVVVEPLVRVSNPMVVLESVKLADDGSGDVVLRLYEAGGVRARTQVELDFPHVGVVETDLLERETGPVEVGEAGVVLELRPFQIRTLRIAR